MTNTPQIEFLLKYLSEIHNKSLALYELVISRPKPSHERVVLNINELFTLYHTTNLFYFEHPELDQAEVVPFLSAFDDFYFELKQVFLNEDDDTALLYNRLLTMKETFEELTKAYNVL